MKTTTLISLRLDNAILKRFNEFCEKHDYYNRSLVINNVLKNIIECASDDEFWKIVSTFDAYSSGYEVKFNKISRK